MTDPAGSGHPLLPRSYKCRYPFTLAAPSFIYPDHYLPNIRLLGPFLDEIELLMFESRFPDSLPSRRLIDQLEAAAAAQQLTYNIHLPTDLEMTAEDAATRQSAASVMARFIRRTLPLHPSAWILHLPLPRPMIGDTRGLAAWRGRAAESVRRLTDAGASGRRLAIETLCEPFEQTLPLIHDLDLSICLDVGHLLLAGRDPADFLHVHRERVSVIHLHAVADGKDHRPLSRLAHAAAAGITAAIRRFSGIISLEVFSYPHLTDSLTTLEEWWHRPPGDRSKGEDEHDTGS